MSNTSENTNIITEQLPIEDPTATKTVSSPKIAKSLIHSLNPNIKPYDALATYQLDEKGEWDVNECLQLMASSSTDGFLPITPISNDTNTQVALNLDDAPSAPLSAFTKVISGSYEKNEKTSAVPKSNTDSQNADNCTPPMPPSFPMQNDRVHSRLPFFLPPPLPYCGLPYPPFGFERGAQFWQPGNGPLQRPHPHLYHPYWFPPPPYPNMGDRNPMRFNPMVASNFMPPPHPHVSNPPRKCVEHVAMGVSNKNDDSKSLADNQTTDAPSNHLDKSNQQCPFPIPSNPPPAKKSSSTVDICYVPSSESDVSSYSSSLMLQELLGDDIETPSESDVSIADSEDLDSESSREERKPRAKSLKCKRKKATPVPSKTKSKPKPREYPNYSEMGTPPESPDFYFEDGGL